MKNKYSFADINGQTDWKEMPYFLYFYRKLSIPFVWFFNSTPLDPNHITVLSFIFGGLAAFLFAVGDYRNMVSAGIFSQLAMILDCTDGMLARIRKQTSKFGAVLDIVLDVAKNNLIILGISIGLYQKTENIYIFLIPLLALLGMNMSVVTHNTQMLMYRGERLVNSHLVQQIGGKQRNLQKIIVRFALSGSFQYFSIGIGVLINQLYWSMIIIAVLQNIYWIGLVMLMYINYRRKI